MDEDGKTLTLACVNAQDCLYDEKLGILESS